MSTSTQGFISLCLACVIGFTLAGLDAFVYHQFGIWFDEVVVGSIMVSLGVHWIGVGNIPPLTLRAPGNVPVPPLPQLGPPVLVQQPDAAPPPGAGQ